MHEFTYFDLPPRADVIRILLHAAGLEFQDTRLTFAEWVSVKPTTPLGMLPVLILDDKDQFCQSVALARYCAKLNDFYPSDPFEALVVDEALDTMSEILAKVPTAKNETETKMQREEFQAGFLTAAAKLLEARIQKYGDGKGFASSPSVADLFLLGVVQIFAMEFFDNFDPKFFDAYPGITATVEQISKNEKVVAYNTSIGKHF